LEEKKKEFHVLLMSLELPLAWRAATYLLPLPESPGL